MDLLIIKSNTTCTANAAAKLCPVTLEAYRNLIGEPTPVKLYENSESGWLWTSFVFYMLLCIVGVLGNLLTIIVFIKCMKKTTTTVFITAVAVVDFFICSTLIPMFLYRLFHGIYSSNAFCKMEKFLAFVTIPLSSGLLLAIAVDRFLLVFVLSRDVVTQFRARLIIVFISALCVVLAIPQPLAFTTITEIGSPFTDFHCKGTLLCDAKDCLPTTDYISSNARIKLWEFVSSMFMVIVALFIVIYTLIFVKVYRISQKMKMYRSNNNTTITTECRNSSCDNVASQPKNRRPSMSSQAKQLEAEEIRMNLTSRDSSDSNPSATEGMNLTNNAPPAQVTEQRTPPRKKRRAHFQTALTLFLVTVTFVVAYTPMIFMRILKVCQKKSRFNAEYNSCNANDYRTFLFNFYFLSHMANPFIYAILNPRFKGALKNGYKKCRASCFCSAKR